MSVKKYSNRSEEDVVRAFKSFIKVMIVNSTCDFKRKYYVQNIPTVPFDELVDNKVSLSMFDDDIFFCGLNDVVENTMDKIGYNQTLSKKESEIFNYLADGYKPSEIAVFMNISKRYVNKIIENFRRKYEEMK